MGSRVMRVVGGLASGLLFGIGLAVMLVLYGKAALGTKAPWLAVLVGLLVGAALGAIPRRRTG